MPRVCLFCSTSSVPNIDESTSSTVDPQRASLPWTVVFQLGVNCIGLVCWCHTGNQGQPLAETVEELSRRVLADLDDRPDFFTTNRKAGDGASGRPTFSGNSFKANPTTWAAHKTWIDSLSPWDRPLKSLLNGSLSNIGTHQGQVRPVEAAEAAAGRHLAEIMLIDLPDDQEQPRA